MSERHYGLKIGDVVKYPKRNNPNIGKVVGLDYLDNNGGMIKIKNGELMHIVCERCEVIKMEE
ncbi:MAG: hypothetical protein ABII01_04565 [Candidatus Woesearchaeota archaeon]